MNPCVIQNLLCVLSRKRDNENEATDRTEQTVEQTQEERPNENETPESTK